MIKKKNAINLSKIKKNNLSMNVAIAIFKGMCE